jgi:hypothetical protein
LNPEVNENQKNRVVKEHSLRKAGFHKDDYREDMLEKMVSQLEFESEVDRRIVYELTGKAVKLDENYESSRTIENSTPFL